MIDSGAADEPLSRRWRFGLRWGAFSLALAALAVLAWSCLFNPKIPFLSPGPGKWIVYPLPPNLGAYRGIALRAGFRRNFVLTEIPASAPLAWRCFADGELRVNGALAARSSSANWKKTSQIDAAPYLRPGSNEILVTAVKSLGPPALSLRLRAGDVLLGSDESWDVSIAGSEWRPARAAAAPPELNKGSELFDVETAPAALARRWPLLAAFAVASALALAAATRLARSAMGPKGASIRLAALLAAAWLILFLHNFPSLPAAAGFDGASHLDYVRYIVERKALPPAAAGLEMFQAPLYYAAAAAALGVAHLRVFSPGGMTLLRFFGLAIGALNVALVFAGLRQIFPGDWKKPLAGAVLAAFLPAHLCLLHYTTNETLSAMFVTAALYVALHTLRPPAPRRGWPVVLGIALGLALLSKSSAAPAVAAIIAALALQLAARHERRTSAWLAAVALPLAIAAAMSGWHYWKLWREYGNPLIGSWDPKILGPWWQLNGYQTPSYYLTFGSSLTHPFFAGLRGFWDALYSTLWADGLWGGRLAAAARPPWNYDLMAAGCLLALAPAALALTGLAVALLRWFRAPDFAWLLLLTTAALYLLALVGMSLANPSYAHVKAFFALPALLPFCAVTALGLEFWAARGKIVRGALAVALGAWLLTVYASFWIRPDAVETQLSAAVAASVWYDDADAAPLVANFISRNPGDVRAIVWTASLQAQRDPAAAVQRLQQAAAERPDDARLQEELARELGQCGRLDDAIPHARLAVTLAPQDSLACQIWLDLTTRRRDRPGALAAARRMLALDPADPRAQAVLAGR